MGQKLSVIIVAGGKGTRFGADTPKQYRMLSGVPVIRHTVNAFLSTDYDVNICIVIHPAHDGMARAALAGIEGITLCHGGDTRQDSVRNGLQALNCESDSIVMIHDAARPLLPRDAIERLARAMNTHDAATLALPVADTLRYGDAAHMALHDVDRKDLYAIQTPQAFRYATIMAAHDAADPTQSYTDDTSLVSALGVGVAYVVGAKENFKITYQDDLDMAATLLHTPYETRIGHGFDVHAFDEDQAADHVILCGVKIPHTRGLKGHSDADVGLHALTDALYGAIGAGDIGMHFPPSDNQFKDMDSAIFLEHAIKMVRDKGGRLINVDVTLMCERPKIVPHRPAIVARMADIVGISADRVNIKATTTEKLGFTGREEGIAAQAVVSVALPIPV